MARWEPDAEGRLVKAAITSFHERGYEQTTVAGIAEIAGLTKRTFFRYFADKREVLFKGALELQQRWIAGIEAAPADASPMAAVSAGLDEVAKLFLDRHSFARLRSQIIAANPELQERELIKLQTLADAIKSALIIRGTSAGTAVLAAQAGVTVFHVAFARWVSQDDPAVLGRLMSDSLAELRSITADV
jgi:AcrR family transcriptional regulator